MNVDVFINFKQCDFFLYFHFLKSKLRRSRRKSIDSAIVSTVYTTCIHNETKCIIIHNFMTLCFARNSNSVHVLWVIGRKRPCFCDISSKFAAHENGCATQRNSHYRLKACCSRLVKSIANSTFSVRYLIAYIPNIHVYI